MNFFKKLFGQKEAPENNKTTAAQEFVAPDNTKLLFYLDNQAKNPTAQNYETVLNELMHGNCSLLLPSVNDAPPSTGWKTAETGTTLKLTCVFNIDGLQVLGAFTDEPALYHWAKQPTAYTRMRAKDVLDFCQTNNINRIVINSDQPNMYVLQRDLNFTEHNIEQATQVMVGAPAVPLPDEVLNNLKKEFAANTNVAEAYQFAMTKGNEQSRVLGLKLDTISDDARIGVQSSIANALKGITLDMPMDVLFLEDSWYETAKGIPNALFYTKG